MRTSFVLSVALVCLVLPASAGAGWGVDPELSTASIATPGHLVLPVRPDGSGGPFTDAYLAGGSTADATVTARLMDSSASPIADYPREDVWLEAMNEGLVACGGAPGILADGNSDADGTVRWTQPPRAGGFADGGVLVYANGMPLMMATLDLTFVSPDFDGDGQVNLTDGGMFTGYIYGSYSPRGDFNNDGTINLMDAAQVAAGLGTGCP